MVTAAETACRKRIALASLCNALSAVALVPLRVHFVRWQLVLRCDDVKLGLIRSMQLTIARLTSSSCAAPERSFLSPGVLSEQPRDPVLCCSSPTSKSQIPCLEEQVAQLVCGYTNQSLKLQQEFQAERESLVVEGASMVSAAQAEATEAKEECAALSQALGETNDKLNRTRMELAEELEAQAQIEARMLASRQEADSTRFEMRRLQLKYDECVAEAASLRRELAESEEFCSRLVQSHRTSQEANHAAFAAAAAAAVRTDTEATKLRTELVAAERYRMQLVRGFRESQEADHAAFAASKVSTAKIDTKAAELRRELADVDHSRSHVIQKYRESQDANHAAFAAATAAAVRTSTEAAIRIEKKLSVEKENWLAERVENEARAADAEFDRRAADSASRGAAIHTAIIEERARSERAHDRLHSLLRTERRRAIEALAVCEDLRTQLQLSETRRAAAENDATERVAAMDKLQQESDSERMTAAALHMATSKALAAETTRALTAEDAVSRRETELQCSKARAKQAHLRNLRLAACAARIEARAETVREKAKSTQREVSRLSADLAMAVDRLDAEHVAHCATVAALQQSMASSRIKIESATHAMEQERRAHESTRAALAAAGRERDVAIARAVSHAQEEVCV